MSNRHAAARPNRRGEEFARSHHNDEAGPSASKKPRFDVRNPSALAPDALEEDAILDADEIGKRGQQTKRNAVNIDGYGSDSSNEGFNARADAKAKAMAAAGSSNGIGKGKASLDEEEADMFADLEEDVDADGDEDEGLMREGKRKRKEVRFLEENEIEGQVAASTGGGHVSANFSVDGNGIAMANEENGRPNHSRANEDDQESSDSDVDDEVRAEVGHVDEEIGAGGKKEHAPKLDAFNMKGEQEEGRFDDQGNFVRKAADPDAVHDQWLEGVSKKDMKRAKEAADLREDELFRKQVEDDKLSTADILRSLIPRLDRGETVLEALARLGKTKKKDKPKWAKNHKVASTAKTTMDDEMDTDTAEVAERKRKDAVEAITGAADHLLTRGQTDIYDAERELLTRQYTRLTGEDWIDPSDPKPDSEVDNAAASKTWRYRWADKRDGGDAHGPYDGPTMKSWVDAGYFGDGVEYQAVENRNDGLWMAEVEF